MGLRKTLCGNMVPELWDKWLIYKTKLWCVQRWEGDTMLIIAIFPVLGIRNLVDPLVLSGLESMEK